MYRISSLTVGLLCLLLTSASAEIHRCRTPDGKLVMTDREDQMPADCQPIDEPVGSGGFNVVPSVEMDTTENQSRLPAQNSPAGDQDITPWQNRADALVESYDEAVRVRHRAVIAEEQRRAEREISRLKELKQRMLNDLEKSPLKSREHRTIRRTLDRIPRK